LIVQVRSGDIRRRIYQLFVEKSDFVSVMMRSESFFVSILWSNCYKLSINDGIAITDVSETFTTVTIAAGILVLIALSILVIDASWCVLVSVLIISLRTITAWIASSTVLLGITIL